jgi:hypothetical protein
MHSYFEYWDIRAAIVQQAARGSKRYVTFLQSLHDLKRASPGSASTKKKAAAIATKLEAADLWRRSADKCGSPSPRARGFSDPLPFF